MQTLHPFLKSKDGFQKPMVVTQFGFSRSLHTKSTATATLKRFLAHREFYIFFAPVGFV